MAKIRSQLLVIDASIARAAGPEDAVHPKSKRCRDFLLAVLEICHRAVFTDAIAEEWKEHQSGFARQWRVSMFARKKIERREVDDDAAFREQLEQAAATDKHKEAMVKDAHLVEAARVRGRRVAALDDKVRELFRLASQSVASLRDICWVNPDQHIEDPLGWLQSGAPADEFRMLGFRPTEE